MFEDLGSVCVDEGRVEFMNVRVKVEAKVWSDGLQCVNGWYCMS